MVLSRLQKLRLELQDNDIIAEQVFTECSNLLLEANVRKVPLPRDLEVFLRYRVVRYGMRNMVGVSMTSESRKKSTYTRMHELVEGVQMRRVEDLEKHLNDGFLLRLRLIHSELMFMFGHEKIRQIPWTEMRFCLAVFLLIFKDEVRYGMFKLLLLPMELMVFVRVTVLSLVDASTGNGSVNIICKQRWKVFGKLKQRHRQVKELYDLGEIYWDVSSICLDRISSNRVQEAALLELVYKLYGISEGNSSGFVAKLSGKIIEGYRDALDSDNAEQCVKHFYRSLVQDLPLLKALLELSLFLGIRLAFRRFLRVAFMCQSFQQLRLLGRFLCDFEVISEQQKMLLLSVRDFYASLVNQTEDLDNQQNLRQKLEVINALLDVKIASAQFNPTKTVYLCDSNVDLKALKHSIQFDLATTLDQSVRESIRLLWSNLNPEQSCLGSQEIPVPFVWKIFQSNRHPFTYLASSNQAELSQRLMNSFEANSISRAVAYAEPVAEILTILSEHSCSTIEQVTENFKRIPRHALMALYRWMVQCYSYLRRNAINLHEYALFSLGHERIFGNLLPDNASIRAETADFELGIVLRALALTELPYEELAAPKASKSTGIAGLTDIAEDGLLWLEQQQSLLRSALDFNGGNFDDVVRQGATHSGTFLSFLGKFDGLRWHTLDTIVSYRSYDVGRLPIIVSNEFQMRIALKTQRFAEAFALSTKDVHALEREFYSWGSLVDAMTEAGIDASQWDTETFIGVVLKLVECSNVRSLRSLLKFNPKYIPDDPVMLKAAHSGCEDLFRELITRRTSLSVSVMQAAVATHLNRAVERFLTDFTEDSLLMLLPTAIKVQNFDFLFRILERTGSSFLLEQAVQLCSRMGRINILQGIFNEWKNVYLDLALLEAASQKHWKMAKLLLSHGGNSHFRRNTTDGVVTAFQFAIDYRCLKFVKRCPVDVNQNKDLDLLTRAAKTGFIPMVRHLLRMGFRVLEEPNFFPTAWANHHEYFQQLLLDTFRLKRWHSSADSISRWHWMLEQWKLLPHLSYLVNCEALLSGDESFQQLLRFALRRFRLVQSVDRLWVVQSIVIDREELTKSMFSRRRRDNSFQQSCRGLQSVLEQNYSNSKQSKLEIHFYSLNGEGYGFVELILYEVCEQGQLEFFVEGSSVEFSVIEDHIGKICRSTDKIAPYSGSVRIFNADKEPQRFELLSLGLNSCSVEFQPLYCTSESRSSGILPDISNENRLSMAMRSSDFATVQYLLPLVGQPEHKDLWFDPMLVRDLVDCQESLHRKIQLLGILFQAAIGFGIQHPEAQLSAISYAISKNELDLAKAMVDLSCHGFSEPSKFVMIIQHGSVDVFELFIGMGNYSEQELFKFISNALLELEIKCVHLPRNLHTFLMFKLSEYGFSSLCGNSTVSKDPTEWIDSILFIVEWIHKLNNRPDCEDFLGIDNNFLFQLRMVHKQLFFIKDKPHLKQLHLREMTFLIAIFLSSFKPHDDDSCEDDESFLVYRIALNKLTLCRFLGLIAKQLQEFYDYFLKLTDQVVSLLNDVISRNRDQLQSSWTEACSKDNSLPTLSENIWNGFVSQKLQHFPPNKLVRTVLSKEPIKYAPNLSKPDRLTQQRLSIVYHRVKQMYSLRKIYLILTRISPAVDFRHMTVVLMKRFVQVFGEFTKNTANSQNLPTKTYRILNQLLHDSIRFKRQTRDITCHDYPVIRKLFPIHDQHDYYDFVRDYLKMVRASIGVLLRCTYFEYGRCLFGSLRQCRTLVELKSLIRFIGGQPTFESDLSSCLEMVVRYNDQLRQALTEIAVESLGSESQAMALDRLKANQNRRIEALRRLSEVVNFSFHYSYQDIQVAAFATSDIERVHRMLQINLLPGSHENVKDLVKDNWVVLRDDLMKLSRDTVESSSQNLVIRLLNFDINEGSLQEHHSREEARKIVGVFLDGSTAPASKREQLEQDLRSKLDQGGKGYFNNIFLVDSKLQAIKDVLKKHCKDGFDQKLQNVRKQDIQELQVVLSGVQNSIMKVLQKYNCSSIKSLVDNCKRIPQEALLALEYWQLELCEMLISTKQFQDNFDTIKCDLQLICGRNYRNYLAHDNLSYDLLTCSSRTKVLVNALVMAQKKWILFDAVKPVSLQGISDSRIEGVKWIEQQKWFSESASRVNVEQSKDAIKTGALTSGMFWKPLGSFGRISLISLTEVIRYENSVQCPHIGANVWNTMVLIDPTLPGRWETLSSEHSSLEVALNSGDFSRVVRQPWKQWLPTFARRNFPCLGGLLRYLDTEGRYEEILDIFRCLDSNILKGLLCIASRELVRFLVNAIPALLYHARRHAIFQLSSVSYLKQTSPDRVNKCSDVIAAVKANHSDLFEYLLETHQYSLNDDLKSVFLTCSSLGRTAMMEIIFRSIQIDVSILHAALEIATKQKRWSTVLKLFEHEAIQGTIPIDAIATAIKCGCLKIVKRFIGVEWKTMKDPGLLEKAAQFGSVKMVKLMLRSGSDIWSSKHILVAASENIVDPKMAAFVESKLFEFNFPPNIDRRLHEWLQLATEFKLVEFFCESTSADRGGLFVFLEKDCQLVKRVLFKVEQFGRTSDGYAVQNIRFFKSNTESSEYVSQIENCIQSLSTDNSSNIHDFQHRITQSILSSSTLTIEGELRLINCKSKQPQIIETKTVFTEKPSPTDFSSALIKTIEEQTTVHTLIGTFEFQSRLFRLLRISDFICVAEIRHQSVPYFIEKLLNSVNSRGEMILHVFPRNGDLALLNFLLLNGANPVTVDYLGRTSLVHFLSCVKSWDVQKHLLEHCTKNDLRNQRGVHIFNIPDSEGMTLLLSATYSKNVRAIEYLLANGADQTIQNTKGAFPLYAAVVFRHTAVVDLLLKNQPSVVNLRQSTNFRRTALFAAISVNNVELVQRFLNAGADLSIRDSEGSTALARAILKDKFYMGDSNVLKAMLEFIVGCPIGPHMDPEALDRLKAVLLAKDHTLASFDAFELANHFEPYGEGYFLLQCYELIYKCKKLGKHRWNDWGPK